MRFIQNWLLVFVLLSAMLFYACADEELNNTLETEDLIRNGGNNNSQGGGNGQGGNNGGNQNNNGGQGQNNNQNSVKDPNTDLAVIDNSVFVKWNDLILDLERYAGGMRPNASARAFAYIYLAVYEVANPAMHNYRSLEESLQEFSYKNSRRRPNINYELALNASLAEVVDHFLINMPPENYAKIELLEDEIETVLASSLGQQSKQDSKDWGRYIAHKVIEYSETDVSAETQILSPQPLSYEPPTAPGFWTYSADEERALFPYWASARTFIVDTDETTTVDPIQYSSDVNSAYYAQMLEVYNLNNEAKNGDQEQLWIAEFWSDDVEGLMFSPPARQLSIANQLIVQEDLSLEESLALFVKLSFSLNDAAVSTWKYKYEHMVMRPNVYIHEYIDPDFQTNLFRLIYWPNPSFPGYPSGHSCFASAAAGVFKDFFGSQINFTDRSHVGRDEFLGSPRSYTSFEQMAEENGYSRIPLGVHIRMDCTEGLRLGYEISDKINAFDLSLEQKEIVKLKNAMQH